jgi:hypothetical protein
MAYLAIRHICRACRVRGLPSLDQLPIGEELKTALRSRLGPGKTGCGTQLDYFDPSVVVRAAARLSIPAFVPSKPGPAVAAASSRTAVLVLCSTAARPGDVVRISRSSLTEGEDATGRRILQFRMGHKGKGGGRSHLAAVEFLDASEFPRGDVDRICPARNILSLAKLVGKLPGTDEHDRLFVSSRRLRGVHGPLSAERLSKLVLSVMGSAGIDTSTFTARSLRYMTREKWRLLGVPTADMNRKGYWLSQHVPEKHYASATSRTNFARLAHTPMRESVSMLESSAAARKLAEDINPKA